MYLFEVLKMFFFFCFNINILSVAPFITHKTIEVVSAVNPGLFFALFKAANMYMILTQFLFDVDGITFLF